MRATSRSAAGVGERVDRDAAADCGLHRLVGGANHAQHRVLLAERAVRVHVVECRLLQEVLAQQPAALEHDALGGRERVGAEQLHDLEQRALALQEVERPGPLGAPAVGDLTVEPGVELVERVAAVPVDRREVPLARERRVEPPERPGEAQAVLRDRLGEVAACRRDGADDRDRARALVAAEADDGARALVELGEPRRQIGGVALLGRHLLQPARHLAQRLAPAARAVGHQRDVVALVAEVLGDRDPRVDARLACGDRHVARVRDEDRPLHQRRAGARIGELRKLVEHLRQLVAALAAGDVDDHVGVAPLGERLLEHRLAGAEAARDRRGAAAREREERVDRPLTGDERRVEAEPARGRARRGARASARASSAGCRRSRRPGRRCARRPPRTSVTVPATPGGTRIRCVSCGRLLHGAEHVSGVDRVADGDGGLELPDVARGRAPAARQPARDHRASPRVVAGAREHRQGALRAVEDRAEQAGAELRPGAARRCRPPARRRSAPRCPRRPGSRRRGRRGGSPRRRAAHARPRRRCRGASRAGPSRRPPVRPRRGSRRSAGRVGSIAGAVTSSRLPGRR